MLTGRAPLTETQAKQMNPITLAFVGDAVYSTYVREKLALEVDGRPADLQRVAAQVVSAKGQSAFLDELAPLLTEAEQEIFRRGKNAKKPTHSKGATKLEYNRSTGFEAVLGYLYLTGNDGRITELLALLDKQDLSPKPQPQAFKPIHR